jgi:hypothetical protein
MLLTLTLVLCSCGLGRVGVGVVEWSAVLAGGGMQSLSPATSDGPQELLPSCVLGVRGRGHVQ